MRICAPTANPTWIGRGESTPSQTAWALLALLAAEEHDSPATQRGIAWLVDTQRSDGGWDEDHFTGTGFPGDFYINYHLYRLVFPVWALGRYLRRTSAGQTPADAGTDHAPGEPATGDAWGGPVARNGNGQVAPPNRSASAGAERTPASGAAGWNGS